MATTPDPELEYLSPGFDPSSLTMPKLRNILVAHSVAYPSTAKKGQLVDIFNENVVPQARKILGARARTKRSVRGIIDVPSSQEPSLSDDESDRDAPPPTKPSRTPRTVPRQETRKSAEVTSPSKPATGARSGKRLAPKIPSPTEAKLEPALLASSKDEPAFSADNPFQSGSSPIPEVRNASDERRRRTVGPSESKDQKKRSTSRRKTDYATTGVTEPSSLVAPTSKKITVPLSQISKGSDRVPAGEEFTSEEQEELAAEQRRTGLARRPAKRQKTSSQTGSFAKLAPWAISLAMLGGLATVWRQEKISVGFCGVGRPSAMLAGVKIPEWADAVRPQCEPCPSHAYCYEDLGASCEPDFVLVPHPLSARGLVPLPPTCEPDGEKARKVQAVADRAVSELRERNAQFECGELKDEDRKRLSTAELEEPELKETVASKRRKGMSQEEFEELWEPALGEMLGRDEIVSEVNTQTGRRTLRSISHANIPLACAIRRSLRHALARHLWKLIAVILAAGSILYGRARIQSGREAEARAKHLASFALDRLATQAALHAQDPNRTSEPWISMSQLRDDVLRDEFSAKRRQMLWVKVQKKVEDNANIRSMVREGRSGEISRVWEWIGALDLFVDDARRRSGRYSVGGPVAAGSPADSSIINAELEMSERRN